MLRNVADSILSQLLKKKEKSRCLTWQLTLKARCACRHGVCTAGYVGLDFNATTLLLKGSTNFCWVVGPVYTLQVFPLI